MCVLFVLVGGRICDPDGKVVRLPSILCSNRDEYFNRKTIRGVVTEDTEYLRYSPRDASFSGQGKGSWIGYSLRRKSDGRFAAVLNLHHWRYPTRDVVVDGSNSDILLSRGDLVGDFIFDGSGISSELYAERVFRRRHLFRPFNLIVGDTESGCFYVSSYAAQTSPRKLLPGCLYGVSNGYMSEDSCDGLDRCNTNEWQKVRHGRECIGRVLKDHGLMKYFCDSTWGHETFSASAPKLAEDLLSVLKDSSEMEDFTIGRHSRPLLRMSSIFVRPILLVRPPRSVTIAHAIGSSNSIFIQCTETRCCKIVASAFMFTYATVIAVMVWIDELRRVLCHLLSNLMQFQIRGDLLYFCAMKLIGLVMHAQISLRVIHVVAMSAIPFSSYQEICETTSPIENFCTVEKEDIFGTRTSTVIMHFPSTELISGNIDRFGSQEMDEHGGKTRLFITERDFDVRLGRWSTVIHEH